MENNLQKSLWVTLLILAVLIILYFVPPIRLGNTTLRRVDLLSDLRGSDNGTAPDRNHAVRDSAAIGISDSSVVGGEDEPVMDDSFQNVSLLQDQSKNQFLPYLEAWCALFHEDEKRLRWLIS